jgi:hypothetical protein
MIAQSELLDRVERIEVATIEPGDILFIHLDQPISEAELDRLRDKFREITGPGQPHSLPDRHGDRDQASG